MLISNLERFVRMCKSRCEREFKEEAKGRGVEPHPVGERNGSWEKAMFPILGCLKLGMPPALPLDETRNMLE